MGFRTLTDPKDPLQAVPNLRASTFSGVGWGKGRGPDRGRPMDGERSPLEGRPVVLPPLPGPSA